MGRKKVKRITAAMAAICIIVITVVFAIILIRETGSGGEGAAERQNGYIIELNAAKKLYEAGDKSAPDKIENVMAQMREDRKTETDSIVKYTVFIYVISAACIAAVFAAVYMFVLKPFDELEEYAGEIASGNLEREFMYHRVNMFGKFTWAFDHMRREIVNARKAEQEAVENNKTVIAALSHDIMTPIASVRGYAEGMVMNMDSNPERRERYAKVIMSKCDEVKKITDDMFLHSLHALDQLIIKREPIELSGIINETVKDMNADNRIEVKGVIENAVLPEGDAGRLAQVIENILANSKKYAPGSAIEVSTAIVPDNEYGEDVKNYILTIRDYGSGIPDEDMPFVFDKFYRGGNTGEETGAGLGLFIVKYIVEKMGGRVVLKNCNGLIVQIIFLRIS